MSCKNNKFSANMAVLVLALVVFCIAAFFAHYAIQQDYGLDIEIEADAAKIGSGFCGVAYIYGENHHNMVFVSIVDNKIRYKIPASTRGFTAVNILYGVHVDKTLIDNNFIDHAFVGRILIDGVAVKNDDLLGALAQARDRLQLRFALLAAVLGLAAAVAVWALFYCYRKKAFIDKMLARTLLRLQLQLHSVIGLFHNKKFRIVFLLFFAVIILLWRRPGQFWYPYIFAEDGTFIIDQYISYGWKSLFYPVNGYYITTSRIINMLAFKISFWYYPELASLLTNLFTISVVFAVAYSPTHLKRPYLCAIMTLLVKTGSECFGVALYSFWWAGLLLVLAVIWQDGKRPLLRNFFILLGGFSCPIVYIATPLLVFLAIYKRKVNDIVAAIIVLIPCVLQIMVIHESYNAKITSTQLVSNILVNILGSYTFLQTRSFWLLLLGGILLAVILISHLKFSRLSLKSFINDNLYYLLLLAWLGGVILASIYRVDWLRSDRRPLGFFEHRYFFYPFIILSWLNIWIIAELPNLYPKIILKIFMILVLFNFLFGGAYKAMPINQPDFNWREQLALYITGYKQGVLVIVNEEMYAGREMSKEGLVRSVMDSLFYNDIEANLRKFGLDKH